MHKLPLWRCGTIFFSLLLVAFAFAESQVTFSTESSISNNSINGLGATQSSLIKDSTYLNMLSVRADGSTENANYSLSIGGKVTDDPQADIKKMTLTQIQGRVTSGKHTVVLGDCFESFSQYALSSGLKGVAYRLGEDNNSTPSISLIYGVAYPRWDNFTNDTRVKTIRRTAYGMRVKVPTSSTLTLGLSGVRSNDSAPVNPTDALYDANTYAIDWDYRPFDGLSLQGDVAQSNADVTAGAVKTKESGMAYRMTITGDADPSRVTLDYERVSPDFVTTLGSASTDREKAKLRWRFKQNKQYTWNYNLLWYHDNLDNKKAGTTTHLKPEIGVSIRKPFQRKQATLRCTTQLDHVNGQQQGNDLGFNVGYTDTFGKWDNDTNVGFTNYKSKGTRDANEWTANTSVSTRISGESIVYKPEFRIGTWRNADELSNLTDLTYEYSAGLGLDFPESNFGTSFRVGQNRLLRDTAGDDSNKVFGNVTLTYRPQGTLGKYINNFFVRAQYNDYSFTTKANNFRETSFTGGLNFQY